MRQADKSGDRTAQEIWLENLGDAGKFNRWVFSRFEKHLGPAVLEIGCGTGNFTALMSGSGHHVTGVDIHAASVEIAQRRLARFPDTRISCCDATTAEWAEEFDTVVLLDVLEHIGPEVDFLNRLKRALKSDGRFVLKVPAGPWLHSGMDDAIGHYRRYDKKSLAATLRNAGLTPESMIYFNVPGILGWWLNGHVLKRTVPPREQIKLFEALVPLFRLAERAVPPPFGLSLIAVARPSPG